MNTLLLTPVVQRFPRPRLDDAAGALRRELDQCGVALPAGGRVAIGVGSRGIAQIDRLVGEVVAWVKRAGATPFIVPAMGSHGGATAAGQAAVLEGYGIDEARSGAAVESSLEVIELPAGDCPVPVYMDRRAAGADATIVLNRIKPHTSFHGRYESGLMKMLAIGLGKHRQALAIHALGLAGLKDVMPAVARQVLAHGNVRLGVAIVENAYDEPMAIRAIPAARIPDEEPALLDLARAHMPSLPLDAIDVLLVDEIGKNVSGLGMDPNVIGRLGIRGQPEPERPAIRAIVIRGLTPETHGNAAGMGLADIILQRAFKAVDFNATYANVTTTGFLERGKVPVIAETDGTALKYAFGMPGMPPPATARILRIRNTLHLDRLWASPSAVAALAGRAGIEVGASGAVALGPDGMLTSG